MVPRSKFVPVTSFFYFRKELNMMNFDDLHQEAKKKILEAKDLKDLNDLRV